MRRLAVAALLAGLAVVGLAPPAFAHDVLVGSDPAAGAQVATGPAQVRLDFNAPVQTGPDTITVIGPGGGHYERSEAATVAGNSVSTAVAPLGPAGAYTIGYRVISADGHPVQGEVTFTLTKAGAGAPVTPAGLATAGAPAGGGGVPIWVWFLAGAVLVGAGLFVALRGGRGADRQQ